MDIHSLISVLRDVFMLSFIALFILDFVSKHSFTLLYLTALTLGVICWALMWHVPAWLKAVFVIAFGAAAVKNMYDVRVKERREV